MEAAYGLALVNKCDGVIARTSTGDHGSIRVGVTMVVWLLIMLLILAAQAHSTGSISIPSKAIGSTLMHGAKRGATSWRPGPSTTAAEFPAQRRAHGARRTEQREAVAEERDDV